MYFCTSFMIGLNNNSIRYSSHLDTALGAVVPNEADVGRVNTRANEHIEVLVDNVFQLHSTSSQASHHARSRLLVLRK